MATCKNCGKDFKQYRSTDRACSAGCESALRGEKQKRKSRNDAKIAENRKYYAKAISNNILKNKGFCICENCDAVIKNPIGRNVSHIIGAGANIALYHDIDNHFILCLKCESIWTDSNGGLKKDMRIFEQSEIKREELNFKYYSK